MEQITKLNIKYPKNLIALLHSLQIWLYVSFFRADAKDGLGGGEVPKTVYEFFYLISWWSGFFFDFTLFIKILIFC